VAVDPRWLGRYRAIIGAVDDGALPPCTPQVLAVGLHLRILGDKRFPLPVLGMVHTHNRIEERAAIPATATLELHALLEGETRSERGIGIDITTEARVDGVLAWRSVLTALIRDRATTSPRAKDGPPSTHAEPVPPQMAHAASVPLAAHLGRRYSRLAGDANPIHWSALTARPFGFPRAIIHGMWTLGRALSEVDGALPTRPRVIAARFVRPAFLPGSMEIGATAPDERGTVIVRATPTTPGPPHMLADVSPAP
jgi:acyl dehydratase